MTQWLNSADPRYFGTLPPGLACVVASDAPAILRQEAARMQPLYSNRIRVCDGTSDELDIAAATGELTGGGTLLLVGPGTLTFGAQLITATNNLTVESWGGVTVKAGTNISASNITDGFWKFTGTDVDLSGFTLDGNRANQTASIIRGIGFYGSRNKAHNLYVKGCKGLGVFAGDSSVTTHIYANYFQDNIEAGAGSIDATAGSESSRVVIINNSYISNERGILLQNSTGFVVMANQFDGTQIGTGEDSISLDVAGGSFLKYGVVEGNRINGQKAGIVFDDGPITDVVVIGNTLTSVTGASQNGAIAVTDSKDHTKISIIGNVIDTCDNSGIRVGTDVAEISVVGNTVIGAADIGIQVIGYGGSLIRTNCNVSNNYVSECGSTGIRVDRSDAIIAFNVCRNNCNSTQALGDAGHGIVVGDEPAAKHTTGMVIGNKCYDDQGTPTQKYGFYVDCTNASSRVRVALNDFTGNATGPVSIANGTGVTWRDNLGYVTRNYGSTSVADGGTVSHGLAAAPTRVTVTPTTSGEMVSVTAKAATTFTVAIKKHDGTGGTTANVDWEAEI